MTKTEKSLLLGWVNFYVNYSKGHLHHIKLEADVLYKSTEEVFQPPDGKVSIVLDHNYIDFFL